MHLLLHISQITMPYYHYKSKFNPKQVAFQSKTNHPLAESTDYIKFEGM